MPDILAFMEKKCVACGLTLPEEGFPRRPTKANPEGRRGECWSCKRKRENVRYHKFPDRQREYSERWRRKISGTETNADRMRRWMREQYKASEKERRKSPEYRAKVATWEHARQLRRYGLTEEQFRTILAKQRNRCPLCSTEFNGTGRQRAIDHCHNSKVVRGILCGSCNMALHKLERDLEWATRAIQYLRAAA